MTLKNANKRTFLPTTPEEIRQRGWGQADVILITGDAYVDHPSFGVALIGRWLEKLGYRVAVLAQPDWRSVEEFRSLGRPRLFWGITSGCIDSATAPGPAAFSLLRQGTGSLSGGSDYSRRFGSQFTAAGSL